MTETSSIKLVNGQTHTDTMRKFHVIVLSLLLALGIQAAEKTAIAYVSLSGDDSNNGSMQKPYKTLKAALKNTQSNATIIIRGGDYYETINIAEPAGRQSLTIKSFPGERVRFLCGEKIEKVERMQSYKKVLKVSLADLPDSRHYKLFQHDVADKSTLIGAEERHPLHRGKTYRCNSTPLLQVNAISEIESSNEPVYYYSKKEKMLYFSIVEGTNVSKNPIFLPTGKGLYGGNNEIELTMIGIEMLYAPFNLSRCPGAKMIDCAVKYAYSGGGFMYNMSTGIEFIRCEAARIFSSGGNGDGFNGHSRVIHENHPDAKHTTVSLVDCWSHDNYDDGYSNHERCEGVIRGGLFEYNRKFGVGSGYGAHESVYGAISRFNAQYGFVICADIYENEGGYASQMILHNCISEGNERAGYLAYTSNNIDANSNSMILYDCYSIKNKVGFEVRDKTLLRLVNCKDYNSELLYKGTPVVENIEVLK